MKNELPKKFLALNILELLHRYSDEYHRLSQKDIIGLLQRDYGIKADRKTVRLTLSELCNCGYPIEYKTIKRRMPIRDSKASDSDSIKLEESEIKCDYYLERQFTDAELRLLIDGLLFSHHIPFNHCRELIDKLEGLSNVYFRSHVRHISRIPEDRTLNQQLFLNIELLDEAINKGRKVSFQYLEYGTDKHFHIKKRSDGSDRYVVSPYQMATRNEKYYLICNYDKYDDISNYRLDRMQDIRILDEVVKPFEKLKWSNGHAMDLNDYMKEHPYMYSSDNIRVIFKAVRPMISDIIDTFGADVRFLSEDEQSVTASVFTNEMAMWQFAKSFVPDVIILEPARLALRVRDDLKRALDIYNGIVPT